MGRMEAEQSEQGRGKKKKKKKKKQKAGRLLQQQGRKSGQFLSLNESLLQENTQLYREATDLAVGNCKLNKRAGSMEADLHMEQKKNARLENELSAVKRTLVDVQAASVEKQQQQARQAAAQGGLAARKANGLLQKHGACLKKGNAAIASLKGQVGELKRQLQQAEKGAVRKDRQAAHADSEVARQHAKAGVALAPLQGGLAPHFHLEICSKSRCSGRICEVRRPSSSQVWSLVYIFSAHNIRLALFALHDDLEALHCSSDGSNISGLRAG